MEAGEKSEFNDAIGFLNRCNQLFYAIDNYGANLDLFQLFQHLRILFKELSPDMTADVQREYQMRFNEVLPRITSAMRNGTGSYGGDVVAKLDAIEIDLRKLFADKGYQTKMKDMAEKALK